MAAVELAPTNLLGTPRSTFLHLSQGQKIIQCLESRSRPYLAVPDFRGGLPLCAQLRRLSTSVNSAWRIVRWTKESAWMGSLVNIRGWSFSYSTAFIEKQLEAAAIREENPRRQSARSRAGLCLARRDAFLFSASLQEASRFENQFSSEHNCAPVTVTLQSGIEPGPLAWWGRVGRPPVWDTHPAATCRGFLLFTKERKKKVCNKRQSLVCLGAFIPWRKDRCAHCQALGSYGRVSAEPQPGASGVHNKDSLRARLSGLSY